MPPQEANPGGKFRRFRNAIGDRSRRRPLVRWNGPWWAKSAARPTANGPRGQWTVDSGQWAVNPKSEIRTFSCRLARKFNVTSGLMEITYDSGVKVILEGPCRYEVESARGGFLAIGKLTARVEKRAEGGGRRVEGEVGSGQWAVGSKSEIRNPKSEISNPQSPIPNPLFVVRTPTAVVTDLGTEFGVEVTADQRSKVSVFAGQVELRTAGSIKASRQRRVLRGDSWR